MSNSVRPHGLQPTRLLHPWDSPGKNTGVGCHFLLQCMKVESESEVAQSCLTLCDPMDCSLPGSSIHGIFQATVLEWGVIAFSLKSLYTKVKKEKLWLWSPVSKKCSHKYLPRCILTVVKWVPLHCVPGLVCIIHRVSQRRWHITSRLRS